MAEPTARLEFAGFVNAGSAREFSFRIHAPGDGAVRTVVLVIAHQAFAAGNAKLQDGPDICYQKLLQLTSSAEPMAERIVLTEEDLYHYRHAHAPKPTTRRRPPVTPAAPRTNTDADPDARGWRP